MEKVLFPFGFLQPKAKPKLRSRHCQLYSMVREWRSGNLGHSSTSHPCGKRDLTLRSKDSGGRSEGSDGETYALVCRGRGSVSSDMGSHPFSVLF